jgi:hypothetical protein
MLAMRRAFVTALTAAALVAPVTPAAADPLPERSERLVEYRISVTLDAAAKTLKGRERLRWRNPSTGPVAELWFHLYLNAFRNSRSTFFRESGGQVRGDRMASEGWGWIDVTSIRLPDGADLKGSLRFVQPDDGNPDDRTVALIQLPAAVEPGASIDLEIEFTAKLPRVFARTGYHHNFFMIGQWFPKLGVYEPAGMRGRTAAGWNCHQFHANSEFYADFGTYTVDFTVPSSFVVGATGERKARKDNGDGTTTYTYEQADVHDFAWTADPGYREIRATFSAANDVTPAEYAATARLLGRSPDEVRLSDVEIIVLMQPARLRQAERYVRAAKLGLKYFGLWYGRYPYRTLTIVDPAPGAGGAGGMEYPTLITGGTAWPLGYWPLSGLRAAEEVTVHEFGHQFWYGLVGNNEFEEAWLDEGLDSYSTGKVMELGYGKDSTTLEMPGLRLGEVESLRMQNGPNFKYDKVRQPAWTYMNSNAYGFYSYRKPEILLFTLERYLGEQTMSRIMRSYHERWRFRHPSSDDFYAVAHEIAGQDLTWFFSQAVEAPPVLDYDVESVTWTKVGAPRGDPAGPAPAAKPGDADLIRSRATVRRRGEFVFPVDIAFKFAGRPVERTRWDGRDPWKRYEFIRPERLEWVDVDPDRHVLLDANWSNNARRTEPDGRVAAKWAARWLFWLQNAFAMVGW